MRIVRFMTNFTSGELDPLLRSRTDLQQYQNGLEAAKNVVIQPQGGVRRRDGLEFLYDFTGFTAFKIIPFEYSTTDSYLLVFVDGRIYVFKAGVLQTNINGSGNSYITATGLTAAMLDELNFTQAVDTVVICHEDLQTKRLVRNSDTNWTWENLPLTNIPKYAYEFDEHSPRFTITPSAVTGNVTITASSATTDTGNAQAGSSTTITLKSATSFSTDDQPNGMFVVLTSGPGAGQTRHIEDYVASTKVATVTPAWVTAPTSSTGYKVVPFAEITVGEYLQVTSGFGRARYVEYISDTVMKAVTSVPFFDTSAITSGKWTSEHGYEDSWSATRGWPRSATFHQGRLYFGGSKSRTNTIWGSRVINYFDFDLGTGLADEGLEATLNTDQYNAIVNVASGSDLRIFTTGGEFIIANSSNGPITPSTLLVRPQTRLGTKAGVPIQDLNGASVFIQRSGKSINAFQYTDTTASYSIQPLSVLSSHLVKNPVDLAVRRGTSTDETDTLYVVNGDDGTMTVYSILSSQGVIAASEFTTGSTGADDFLAVAVEIDRVFVIVKRTVNGSTKYYLERFSSDVLVDSAKIGTSGSTVAMEHLRNTTVKVLRDGRIEVDKLVPNTSPYEITFTGTATISYQVGLGFDVEIRTMPQEPNLPTGTSVGVKKRVLRVDALVKDSQSMAINGTTVPFTSYGTTPLDEAVGLVTGLKTVHGILGYTETGQISITQPYPLKLNLIGMEYRLSLGE
ncbi:hypothetical protein UFOVP847_31 [uncultured Caudovirales phage]|uniref:Tail tubular protein B n=1 Tax=uncultured Caudovirales phage TaxID=2100421 RepID=A0A6J5P5Z8_9CAUD|nr:hypothetical protein UFOVP847_31 [uncultured Caudovirales phage]